MCEKYMVLLKVCGQIILVYWETWVKYMFIYKIMIRILIKKNKTITN